MVFSIDVVLSVVFLFVVMVLWLGGIIFFGLWCELWLYVISECLFIVLGDGL